MKKFLTISALAALLLAGCSNTQNLQGSFSNAKDAGTPSVDSSSSSSATSVKSKVSSTSSSSASPSSSASLKTIAKVVGGSTEKISIARPDRVDIAKWTITPKKDGQLTSLQLSWPDTSSSEISFGSSGSAGSIFENVLLEVTSSGTTTKYELTPTSGYPSLKSGSSYDLVVTGTIKSGAKFAGGLSMSSLGITLDSALGGKTSYTWTKDDGYAVNTYFDITADTEDGMLFGGVTFN